MVVFLICLDGCLKMLIMMLDLDFLCVVVFLSGFLLFGMS